VSTPSRLRFDGRVAVVTGAGRGLGRSHAGLLASPGAMVVVNDLGVTPAGEGRDSSPAEQLAQEIMSEGGSATANSDDICTTNEARAIVDCALAEFGRLDIVVNNAGIFSDKPFVSMPAEDMRRQFDVNVVGAFNVSQAAWPHLAESGHGRVILTSSATLFGSAPVVSYSTSKAAVFGLTRSLAEVGRPDGILVNAIAPFARTRLSSTPEFRARAGQPHAVSAAPESRLSPESVSPMVALLAHESFTASGEVFGVGRGRFARLLVGETRGYIHPGADPVAPEDVQDHLCEISEVDGWAEPTSIGAYLEFFEACLQEGYVVGDEIAHQ
jgi:NAD(P)-dependent dehydrogenase (short-subunit alcohol dehydrogenase family)